MNKFISSIVLITFLTGCDRGFQELNENPNNPTQISIESKLTAAQLHLAGGTGEHYGTNIIYTEHIIQHLATVNARIAGDFYVWHNTYASTLIRALYPGALKNIFDMLVQVDEENKPSEMKNIIRIQKVLTFYRLTDLYGDIPYFEAAQGYISQISFPKYDRQEDIYYDMLKELEEAVAGLPDIGTSAFGETDIYYKGDFTKWKKLGNSLMLRLGLRMIKVEPTKSEEWVRKAIAGGVMESIDDSAIVQHSDGPAAINKNNLGEAIINWPIFRASKTLIDFMRDRNDPRLNVIVSLPENSPEKDDADKNIKRTTEQRLSLTDQRGIPNGTSTLSNLEPPLNSSLSYSEPNRLTMIGLEKPSLIFSYVQIAFNLAEAAKRWGIGGDPAENYNKGIKAAMEILGLFGDGGKISEEKITAYINENPYNDTNAIKLINEQYWISCFLDGYEAFANWRRTNYPTLVPVNSEFGDTNGTIPRRLTYPRSEVIFNTENYNAVNARQGPDNLTTRVWWDKE